MLYEIESQAAAHNSVILLHPEDSVAIARKNIETGREFEVNGVTVRYARADSRRAQSGHSLLFGRATQYIATAM